MTGRFIVLEGVDGSGKSTQAKLLAAAIDAHLTREPGGTPVGSKIREILLDPETGTLADRAEALLMAADRAHHVESLVKPLLASGRSVVSDRYLGSSVAYQGHARGLDPDEVRDLSLWATDGLLPDLVVLLEIEPATASARIAGAHDRLEQEGVAFQEKVAEGYRHQRRADPDRWRVVDVAKRPADTAARILEVVCGAFPELARTDGESARR